MGKQLNDSMTNEISQSEISMINDGGVSKTERIAKRLCNIFSNEDGYMFYLKIAWHTSESWIWSTVETAKTKSNPRNYFSVCGKNQLGKTN